MLTSLLLNACALDNNLSGQKVDVVGFDTGDTWSPAVDTGDTDTTPTDTYVTLPQCSDRFFAGGAVSTRNDCDVPTAHPSWKLVQKWAIPSSSTSTMFISAPSIAQLNDDNGNGRIDDSDTPDVVIAPYTGSIGAYSGLDGSELWSVTSSQIEQTTPAIADLDGDGFPEVVIGGLYGTTALHGEDGSSFWSGSGPGSVKSYCGGIGIADLEADGEPEVYFGAEIIDGMSGVVKATGGAGVGTGVRGESPMSIAADMDLDGYQEVIVGNAAYDYDGNTIWNPGGNDGFPAIGNFDADNEGEVVSADTSAVRLVDDDGTELWSYSTGSGYNGPPMIADVDGDGLPEVVIPTNNGVYVLEDDGSLKWSYAKGSGGFYNGTSAYDLDGDGDWEIIVNGYNTLLIFDGSTGTVLSSYVTGNTYPCGQAPAIADMDLDGHVDIAVNVYARSSTGSGTIVVDDGLNDFVLGRPIWNEHDYAITNVNDDSTVPAVPDTNWLDYNSFRAGPPVDAVAPSANLAPFINDVCPDECGQGNVTVWYSVLNDGTEAVTDDVVLELYGSTGGSEVLLWSGMWTTDLASGWRSEAESVELTGVPVPLYDLRLVVDRGDPEIDEFRECDETDNVADWGEVVCL